MPAPKINRAGLDLIMRYEGFRPKPYDDGTGVITIGYGHTRSKVMPAEVDQELAKQLLVGDLEYFTEAVANAVQVPINENQYSALVAFTYNLGEGNLRRSTLLRKLNAGDYGGAANEFEDWTKAGGKEMKGLVRRRAAEAQLFRTPPPTVVSTHEMPAAQAWIAMSQVAEDGQTIEGFDPQFSEAHCILIVPGARMLSPEAEVADDEELQAGEVSIARNEGSDSGGTGHPDIGVG